MTKRLQEYVRYSKQELDRYADTKGSCVSKINTDLHLSIGAYSLADFKQFLSKHILRKVVGHYNIKVRGIILDLKNVKVLGIICKMRPDDSSIHINVNADCYVLRPTIGAVLTGKVNFIGYKCLGVIIYRVFSVNIRLKTTLDENEVKRNENVQFRISDFNLQNVIPYIEGELIMHDIVTYRKVIFETDSGIENNTNDLDELIRDIKEELISEEEVTSSTIKKKESHITGITRKRRSTDRSLTPIQVKRERSIDLSC